MLTFDPSFHSDRALGCFLWADETVMRRVRFHIGHPILGDVLHGGNPVHDSAGAVRAEPGADRSGVPTGVRGPPR